MEKYGQYRDKGSGIAPFFPIPAPASSPLLVPYHIFLFCLRWPLLVFAWVVWFAVVQWMPAGSVFRKANLWCILGIPGVWWIDIRVDGVHRGSLGKSGGGRLPGPGTIIASSFTSPLDVLYLAAIFDPIFTQSDPGSPNVQPISLEGALASCLGLLSSPHPDQTVSLSRLVLQNPSRVIVVFPEATTSNGRGVLRLSSSLLSASKTINIFPVSLRYTPPDVVTPIPGWSELFLFWWKLCSRQTHCIRVRIGHPMTIEEELSKTTNQSSKDIKSRNGYDTNFFDSLDSESGKGSVDGSLDMNGSSSESRTDSDQRSLDAVAEALSRLGRAKTLGLGVEEKTKFVDAWTGKTKKRR